MDFAKNVQEMLICIANETPPEREITYICDFRRCRLNVRLTARIQPLLPGHKYRFFSLSGGCSLAAYIKLEFKFVKIWGFFRSLWLAGKLNLRGLTFTLCHSATMINYVSNIWYMNKANTLLDNISNINLNIIWLKFMLFTFISMSVHKNLIAWHSWIFCLLPQTF